MDDRLREVVRREGKVGSESGSQRLLRLRRAASDGLAALADLEGWRRGCSGDSGEGEAVVGSMVWSCCCRVWLELARGALLGAVVVELAGDGARDRTRGEGSRSRR
ncbi:uncharacterized protein A4U43_C05F10660 [Asparagus officinalis]|uniref:Uncharacterized protein n=1 Tax=Asparagus officinalis TaxID=4686 RepID=A0A5P1ERB9_ASPOF|nr:uncharacterized protein A4U43_C05F10660 [Asparagus officinalis]